MGDPDEHQSKFQRGHATLRQWILDGRFRPGERLPEVDLAQLLGVSRTTARAVLVDLNKQGLVTIEANRGARVRAFTRTEALDILYMRERLEGVAAGLAARNATDAELDDIGDVVEAMAEAERSRDDVAYRRLVYWFHTAVINAARSSSIIVFLEQLQYGLVRQQFRNFDAPHPRTGSAEEHAAVLVALRRRDPVAAEQMMRMHVSASRTALLVADPE